MSTCKLCNKKLSHEKYTLCASCVKLGKTPNYIHGLDTTRNRDPFYQVWQHKKLNDPALDMTAFFDMLGGYEHGKKQLSEGMAVYTLDDGASYEWRPNRKLRGLARKAKDCRSPYIGTVEKLNHRKEPYYYAVIDGKYIKGSCSVDEETAAAIRDNEIIKRGHQDRYRLNFS